MKNIVAAILLTATSGFALAQNPYQVNAEFAALVNADINTTIEALNVLPLEGRSFVENDNDKNKEESVGINSEYLNEVQSPSTPEAVSMYQNMASQFEVTESFKFDGRNIPFVAIFKTQKGSITVTYNYKGEVLESKERFKNVMLPKDVIVDVLKKNKGWKLSKTTYNVSYVKDQDTEKYYTMQLTKGRKKKNLTVNPDGAIL